MIQPLIAAPGTAELILILVIVVLVFGAAKLPELARSTGQALKIFKSETKGLIEGDDDDKKQKDASGTAASTADAGPAAPPARELPAAPEDGTTTSSETSTERHPG